LQGDEWKLVLKISCIIDFFVAKKCFQRSSDGGRQPVMKSAELELCSIIYLWLFNYAFSNSVFVK
jgi:hypothetical protein